MKVRKRATTASRYLRTLRDEQGLTQEQLAAISGVPQNTISRLESSPLARPTFGTVQALADALGVDPRTLRFGPDPNRPATRARLPVSA
jgi:transcriptional regulator with XRE-family HTH domain